MTEPTDAPSPGATSDEDGQDPLAVFMASNDVLLDKIYNYIRRRMRDSDGVPAAFLHTVKSFVAYVDRKGISEQDYLPLMLKNADRRILDYWRARDQQQLREALTEPSDMALLADALANPYTDADRRIDIRKALARLSDKQQRALVLRYDVQLTVDETATAMGITESAVKKLVAKARNNVLLHGLLKEYDPNSNITPTRRTTQTGTSEAQA